MNVKLSEKSPAFLQPQTALELSMQLWAVVAIVGQWLFVAYIVLTYWLTAARGDLASWSEVLPEGLIAGDSVGNAAMVMHMLLAAIITFGGTLQLIPKIREIAPQFHRWNGRIYVTTAFVMALSGLYIVWTRGTVGNWVQHSAVSINGVLILAFAVIAVRHIRAGNVSAHRRWALRLFVVVSGVWFFRVGLMFWLAVHQKPVGIDFESFTGPYLYFLAFAQFLLPLAVLEFYLRARDGDIAVGQWSVTTLLIISSLATALGVFAVSMGMWFPKAA